MLNYIHVWKDVKTINMHMFPHNTTVAHCIFQYNSFFPWYGQN